MAKRFYEHGLRFTCTQCSACCRFDSGYVFVSASDRERIAAELKITETEFIERYCINVYGPNGRRISLGEHSNKDCIMWRDGGCSIYNERPMQCRSYPFWPQILEARSAWVDAARSCPGVNVGRIHTETEIEQWLGRHRANRMQE